MQPYYQDAFATLYNANYRDVLPFLEPVDLLLLDPPYGEVSLEWDRADFNGLAMQGSCLNHPPVFGVSGVSNTFGGSCNTPERT